jgi:polyhydroxybutyrate depolymerase
MMVRPVTVVVLATSVLVSGPAARMAAQLASTPLSRGDHTFSVEHGGRQRSYILHVPAITGRALPLVLAFHGGGGEADGYKAYAGLDAVADREAFLVAYPNGSGILPRRLLTWNAGECCGYAMNQRIDDVAFAVAVVDDVARRTAIDVRRVYATGHSNGGMMAYRLGAERADRIAAIAPVAGAYNLERFAPSRQVAMLHIHSVDDPRALYKGGDGPPFPGTNVRASHRPVMEGIERWRVHNGCSTQFRETSTRKGGEGASAQSATLLVWDGCARGAAVAHWRLTGVGHGWPGTTRTPVREEFIGPPTLLISAADEVWKFFAQVSR